MISPGHIMRVQQAVQMQSMEMKNIWTQRYLRRQLKDKQEKENKDNCKQATNRGNISNRNGDTMVNKLN